MNLITATDRVHESRRAAPTLMFSAFGEKMGALTRNPLGIIALFVSLIYGMSALLLGASVSNLTPENQTLLVWFIVAFPCIVLAVFAWLVSQHHRKLYGPGDYRTDEGFLTAGTVASPASLGSSLRAEIEEADAAAGIPSRTGRPEEQGDQPQGVAQSEVATTSGYIIPPRLARAFIAQNLVLQELQNEFGGAVVRELQLGRRRVDGLIRTPNGNIAVEVKTVTRRMPSVLIQQWAESLLGVGIGRGILAIVFDGIDVPERAMREIAARLPRDVTLRTYSLSDLLAKYALLLPADLSRLTEEGVSKQD